MNVVSNAPEYDKKRPGSQKKINNNKNVTNYQNSINLSPKNPYQKKTKNTFFVEDFFGGKKKTTGSKTVAPPLPLCILEPLPHLSS